MLAKELWERVNKQERTTDFLFYLYERWQDEKEYEDINDYLKVLQKTIPEAYRMTKRPFGVVCKCDDYDINIYIKKKGKYMQMFGKMV